MMTAVSFITVDHASLMRGHLGHELNDVSRAVGSHIVASQDTVSISLISDALQLSEFRPIQFRCKVIRDSSLDLICCILIVLTYLFLSLY